MYHTQSINLRQNLRRIGRLAAPFMAAAMLALLLPALVLAATFITTVDTGANVLGDAGEASALALKSNGLAVISYWDKFAGNQGDLKIAFCNDPACSNPTIQTVDTPMEGTRATSIAVTSGDVPVISYSAPIGLKLAICNSATDCSSPTIRVLDSAGNPMGTTSSLVLNSSDVPIVSYTNGTTLQKVAFCQDAACSGVTTRTVETISLDNPGVEGNSVALNSAGAPVISYGYAGTLPPPDGSSVARLRVATCESATDCTAPTVNTLDGVGVTTGTLPGRDSSLELNSSGFPVVSYREDRFGDLKLAICGDALCNSPAFLTTVDTVGNVGINTSLELNSSGFPVISYFESTPNFDLKLATCNDATCSNPTLQTLDSAGSVGPFSSLALNSTDGPVISYYDTTNRDLKLYTNTTGCNTNSWTANNETSLNAAIACYNAKTTAGSYTITLTQDIDLTASTTAINNATSGVALTIAGAGFAVDGQGTAGVRPFEIAANTTVTMNRLIVSGGNPTDEGGGVKNDGNLTLNQVAVTENTADTSGGGIYNGGTGTLTINQSTVSDNTGADASATGGGIANAGTLTINNSTVSGNTAHSGGGISNVDGAVSLDSVTIAANTASSTGAGLYTVLSAVTAKNSILADNSGAADCAAVSGGSITDNGYNLVEVPGSCTFSAGTSITGSDPKLGPLANNGGETETHALLGGSPAINAGDTTLTTDQRGVTRPQDGTDDIGAFESQCGTATSWTAATESELKTAIGCFNIQTAAGSYTITVTQNISLTSSIATIDNPTSGASLVIAGGNHTIDGGDAPGNPGEGGFVIGSPTAVSITDLTVTGCRQLLTGGAIRNVSGGAVTLDNVTLTRNAAGFGGGALSSNAPVTITNSVISRNRNTAIRGGGGILIESPGSLTLIDSEVSDNATVDVGGGISAESGTSLTITRSTIAGNTAGTEGGGLFNDGVLAINNSTISGNAAPNSSGGGLVNSGDGSLTLRNSTISGNSAGQHGGGLLLGGSATLDSVTVANNTSVSFGAGVFPKGVGVITMTNSILADNTSTGYPAGSGAADCGSIGGGHTWAQSYNLVEDGDTCRITADGVNNTIEGVDPQLGPLANNGGGTETHALLDGSPALDAGDTTLTTDQRGASRPFGLADDIGAYESQATGTIVITKQTAPTNQGEFGFTHNITATTTFTLAGGQSETFLNVAPGTYRVTEAIVPLWRLVDLRCDDGNSPGPSSGDVGTRTATITVGQGERVTCIFSNVKLGSITFVKKTEGGDGVFSFSSPQLGNFRLTTQKKTAQRTFTDLLPGTYSASEVPTKGWDLTNASCSDGSNPASINLAPGEQVTCNFRNVKRGALTVVKNSTGGDALFPFASQTLGGFDLTTVGGTAQRVFSNLVAGTYDLSENTPAGWTQTGATCSDGSNPGSVNVAAGEEVTCTFTNVKQGSLKVVKQATGSDATFAFSSTALGAFDLTTVNGTAQRTFANLNAGVYDVSETVPAGWRQESAVCSDGSTLPNVDVAAGEDVTCTFENSQLDTIVIVKLAIGGDDAFPFVSQALGSFVMTTTAGTAVQAFSGLAPGVYDVTESAVAGWTQAEANPQCSNGNPASSITLAAGETVVCIFANLKQDTIVVEKRTVGGDGSFTFSSDIPGAASFALTTVNGAASRAFDNLPSAIYSISEQPQAGWAQTGASCSDGSDPGSINLAPGATVRCIFTDTKLSNITVVKRAVGGDGSFGFTGSLGSFNLSTAGGTAQRTFANLLPGSYRISETVASGWSLTASSCADGSNPGSITLAAGRDLACTFVNTKQGSLTVVKQAAGGDGTFRFTSQTLGDFVITTRAGVGQQLFANLAPAVYDLLEEVASGWDQGLVNCSNGSNPASVSVDAGEAVTCTFENTKAPESLYLPIITNGSGASSSFMPLVMR